MMKRQLTYLGAAILAFIIMASCTPKTQNLQTMVIDNPMTGEEIQARTFTAEVMYKMGRMASVSLSPDGSKVVFSVTFYDMAENKGETSLYLVTPEDGTPLRLTDKAGNDSDPKWSADGKSVYFLSDRSGDAQLWSIEPSGNGMKQISSVDGGIEGYGVSPKGDKAFYVKKVHVTDHESAAVYADMDKSKALVYDDLMVRHWNYWDRGDYSHIFIADISDSKMGEGTDIMPGEAWDAPMAPYFDNSEIAWNNAGTQLAYTCKKLVGKQYAESTDSDIYLYDLASGTTTNLTKGMVGYDKYPVFSPDDKKLAFQSMERPGNESDKDRLMVMDLGSGEKSYLTADFDYNAANIVWENAESLLFLSPIEATYQLCRVDMQSNVSVLTAGDHDVTSFSTAGGRTVATLTTISMAEELFNVNISDRGMTQLTNINAHIYDNVDMGEVQKRWVTTTDGKQMLTWVILPPNFDPAKKYPTLLYCQGGPQSVVSQRWSYRWNYQLMAAQGYVVVAPNRRGLPSFGQEWLDQISGDYSGQNIRDYLSAIDDVAGEPWVDRDRLGCVGASYGGYSSFYLAGVHEKRFKAFISHCGMFNLVSMYGSTEELFFENNDLGGPYWDKDNATAQRTFANSPHTLVDKWDTPILIITGLQDFRIPYTQSLEAFTAARTQNIPARLVAFENEAHQVFKPQNAVVWNREFFGWLDKYLK